MTGWREEASLLASGDSVDSPPSSLLTRTILFLLIALFLFMPLAMGVVHAWSEAVVMWVAGGLALLGLIHALADGNARLRLDGPQILLGLFAALVLFQLVPLPRNWVGFLSPHTQETKQLLLSDLPDSQRLLSHLALSFYSLATQHDLRIVFLAVIVFLTVRLIIRTPAQIVQLLVAIVCVGALVALVAAAQDLSGSDKIYWIIPAPGSSANSGPFGLYNNFAQFLNLSIGAAIGLLLYFLTVKPSKITSAENNGDFIRTGTDLRRLSLHRSRASTAQSFLIRFRVRLLIAFIILAATTILLAGSRGGILSMMIAFVATLVFVGRRGSLSRHRWMLLLIAAAVLSVLLYAGFDAVCDRLATLHNRPDPTSGRWQSFKDVMGIWRKFPVFGTGLGTHQYVYPAYDHSTDATFAEQADGDYVQAAEEVGALGLAIILSFAGLIWWKVAAVIRRARRHSGICTVGFGLAFGLLAVMIQSFVDFGQHLPAIACLSATFCAILLNLAEPGVSSRSESAESRNSDPPVFIHSSWPGRVLAIAVACLALGAGLYSAITADRVRRAEAISNEASDLAATLSGKNWQASNADFIHLLTSAKSAATLEPADISYQYYLNLYRWETVCHDVDPKTGMVSLNPRTIAFAQRIVDELNQARPLCPTYGPVYSVAGQLEYFVLHRPIGERHVATGYALWPNHPIACLDAGMVEADAHHLDDAMAKFQRAILLDGSLFPSCVQILLSQQHRPDLAVSLCQGDPGRLLQVTQYLPKSTSADQSLAFGARRQAVDLLKARCHGSDASADVLARTGYLVSEDHDYQSAADYFRRALAIDYGNVDWRLALADTLKAQGQVPQAMHEARICLRLRPQMPQAMQLVADLSVLPGAEFSGGDQ